MSSGSVCQVARCWVEVGSFHTRLVVSFMIFTESVRNILDTPSYVQVCTVPRPRYENSQTFLLLITDQLHYSYLVVPLK
jgi:hypothetical protein